MYLCNREIRVAGHMLRIARLDAEMYQFLSEPESVIEALRACGQRVDLNEEIERSADCDASFIVCNPAAESPDSRSLDATVKFVGLAVAAEGSGSG